MDVIPLDASLVRGNHGLVAEDANDGPLLIADGTPPGEVLLPMTAVRDRVLAACGGKPGAVEDYPFGDGAAVFKVAGRMFALVPLGETPGSVSLKCDPDLAVGLRSRYAGITPGYHLNKRHWNTVTLDGSVPTRTCWSSSIIPTTWWWPG